MVLLQIHSIIESFLQKYVLKAQNLHGFSKNIILACKTTFRGRFNVSVFSTERFRFSPRVYANLFPSTLDAVSTIWTVCRRHNLVKTVVSY